MEAVKPDKFISFSPPLFDQEEERELIDTLRSGWITTGPKVNKFEEQLCTYVNANYGVGTFSCTDALLLALKMFDLKMGDEVITSPYTFASTAHVVCHHNATPVFVDIEADTFNIDYRLIEQKITKHTKGIIPIHFGGHSCDMDPIMDIANKYNLFVIEDAAHAIGTEYKGKKIGSFGDITCFSFYATKNMTTAEGGMAVTDNENWAKRMRILTMYGISDAREIWQNRYRSDSASIHYDVQELGYKCNMTDLSACLGLCQLKKLDHFISKRKSYFDLYNSIFDSHPGLSIPNIKPYTKSAYHLYPLLLNLDYISISRDDFITQLKQNNIGTSVLFTPLHLFSYYQNTFNYKNSDFPIAENIFKRIICLPISPIYNNKTIENVINLVFYLLDKYKR